MLKSFLVYHVDYIHSWITQIKMIYLHAMNTHYSLVCSMFYSIIFLCNRLVAYDRNANFKGIQVILPTSIMPNWPTGGFKQLQVDHRKLLPQLKEEHLESYFIYRLSSDKIEAHDIKGIKKGENLQAGKRVRACSFQKTGNDLFFTGIVMASMKKKVMFFYIYYF